MKCPLPLGVSNGADFAPTWVRAAARNTPLGLGDVDGGQPGALLAPRPRGRRILRFPAKRKSSLTLPLVLFPPNPLTLGFGGSCGSFPGFAGKPPQIAPRAETRRRIPMQRRVILCGRYGFICRDFRDWAGNTAVPTLSHTCQQRHIWDTSGTLQGQSRDKIDLPPYMKPRCTNAFRVRCHGCTACPTSFSLRRVRDLLHHVLSQAEQSHFLFADPNLSGVLAGRCFNEAFLRQCFQKTFL